MSLPPPLPTTDTTTARQLLGQLNQTLAQPQWQLKTHQTLIEDLAGELQHLAGQGFIGMAQINPCTGDLEANALKIHRYMMVANQLGLEMIIFPELALMGYPIRDVISRFPFLGDESLKWLNALAQESGKTLAAIGFTEPRPHTTGKPFYNSVAWLSHGRVQALNRKVLLPTYSEFHDVRTFEPSSQAGWIHPSHLGHTLDPDTSISEHWLPEDHRLQGVGAVICEDSWSDADFFEFPLYTRNPMAEIAAHSSNKGSALRYWINTSASPSRQRKQALKKALLSHLAQKYQAPLIYVNQVGSIDELSFDGGSCAYNAHGQEILQAPLFEEGLFLVHPDKGIAIQQAPEVTAPEKHLYLPDTLATLSPPKRFDAHNTDDIPRTVALLQQGIRDYFHKNGFQRAILGLSGGIDSAVCAVLLADALGPENVLGVSLSSHITPQENEQDSAQLAKNLGIGFIEVPIPTITESFQKQLEPATETVQAFWPHAFDPQHTAFENLQARSRAVVLWTLANQFGAFPIATSDKSEFYLGYTTLHGDMAGSLAPIGDIPKSKVRLLARWLNTNRSPGNVIPWGSIERPSGADLALDPSTGETVKAEDALMPYEFADEIIWRIETYHQSLTEMIQERFQWEEKNPISPETKALWLNRFFKRMASAVFKWWVAPPILMLDGNGSITKTDYQHPITAGKIRWEGHSPEAIEALLSKNI